jgi:hypothetical protein
VDFLLPDGHLFQQSGDEKMIYILLSFATWRISSLLVNENGPWNIFLRLRQRAGLENAIEIPDGFFPGVLSCVWCCSMWVGAAWTLLWFFFDPTAHPVYGWLALPFMFSALAIGYERLVANGH